jgi:hypothetical protein
VLWTVAGLAMFIVGLVLLVIPGPGIPIVVAGAGLVAREWGAAAVALDAVETWIRRLWAWMARQWKRSPPWARVLEALAVLVVAGAAVVGAYAVVIG